MTLLDAPIFDEARARRQRLIAYLSVGGVLVLVVGWWLLAGRPLDWPWRWNSHLFGRMAVNRFMDDLEKNDLKAAYGVWIHDKNWEQHPGQRSSFPFERFQEAWDPKSPDAEYPEAIHSHRIAASRIYGNVLLTATLVNGAKKDAVDLAWDPRTGELSFAPSGVRLSTVPWAMVP